MPFNTNYVAVSSVNYIQIKSSSLEVSTLLPAYCIGVLVLVLKAKCLSAVMVTSKKIFIKLKIDRMVVNMGASVTNVG